MKKKLFFPIGLILFLVIGIGIWWGITTSNNAPDISLNAIDGKKIALSSLRGKPVLVTFWATSCSSCIKEIPELIDLYHELNPNGLEIIGIAMSYDPPNHVINFSKREQIPYVIALDISGQAAEAFGNVIATPTNILIGPDGKVLIHKTGIIDIDQFRERIEFILNNNKISYS